MKMAIGLLANNAFEPFPPQSMSCKACRMRANTEANDGGRGQVDMLQRHQSIKNPSHNGAHHSSICGRLYIVRSLRTFGPTANHHIMTLK